MNTDNRKPTCMYCGKLIADTSAPDRFCSRACFDLLLEKVKAQWNQRYQEAKANGNGAGNGAVREIKPLSEILETLKPETLPKLEPSFKRRVW
jgi:hypothetical protein